jgi:hypothetical protein
MLLGLSSRMKDALCSRPIQLVVRVTLGVAIIAMFLGTDGNTGKHTEAWRVVGAIGFALAVVSLPALTYGQYSRRRKAAAHDKGSE